MPWAMKRRYALCLAYRLNWALRLGYWLRRHNLLPRIEHRIKAACRKWEADLIVRIKELEADYGRF